MFKILSIASALLISTASLADTSTGSFNVKIALTSRPGPCLSETLSAKTGASVYVVCDSGQFVTIDPQPGRPFLGVHGGAYRYLLQAGSTLVSQHAGISPFIGVGTVTELRLYNADDTDGPLEILISF